MYKQKIRADKPNINQNKGVTNDISFVFEDDTNHIITTALVTCKVLKT